METNLTAAKPQNVITIELNIKSACLTISIEKPV